MAVPLSIERRSAGRQFRRPDHPTDTIVASAPVYRTAASHELQNSGHRSLVVARTEPTNAATRRRRDSEETRRVAQSVPTGSLLTSLILIPAWRAQMLMRSLGYRAQRLQFGLIDR